MLLLAFFVFVPFVLFSFPFLSIKSIESQVHTPLRLYLYLNAAGDDEQLVQLSMGALHTRICVVWSYYSSFLSFSFDLSVHAPNTIYFNPSTYTLPSLHIMQFGLNYGESFALYACLVVESVAYVMWVCCSL